MGWDGMGWEWDLTPMGIGILPFPLVWAASIGGAIKKHDTES